MTQESPLGTPITEEERKAPAGKFRIVCVDFAGPAMGTGKGQIFLVEDVDDKEEAIKRVIGLDESEGAPYIGYQVHDDTGAALVP